MSMRRILHWFNLVRRDTPVAGADPSATRFRGAGVHPIARMSQLATDITADLPPRIRVPRVPLEIQLEIADAMIENGIVPDFSQKR